MRTPRERVTRLGIAGATLVLLLFAASYSRLTRRHDRDGRRHEETKVLRLLGGSRTAVGFRLLGRRESVRTVFVGGVSSRDEAAVLAIAAAGPTLGEKIAASRSPAGEPAEVRLDPEVPISNLEAQLGPPSSRFLVTYPQTKTAIEYYSYGNLDVGVYDGKVVAVRIR